MMSMFEVKCGTLCTVLYWKFTRPRIRASQSMSKFLITSFTFNSMQHQSQTTTFTEKELKLAVSIVVLGELTPTLHITLFAFQFTDIY